MNPPARDLPRRRPVWEALSEFFLDTELDEQQLRSIAHTLAASGYTDDELDSILYEEVYPVCIPNLCSMVGVWEGFDGDEIQARILANERWFWKKWRLFQLKRWMIRDVWSRVRAYVQEERSASPSAD